MRKFCKLVCIIMAAVICFTGCGINGKSSTSTAVPTQQTETGNPQPTSQSATDKPELSDIPQTGQGKKATEISEQFKNGINNFSYKIFDQMENGENIFISPYSMAIAISMLDNGAEGKSKEEIEQMLGIEDLENWNACVKYYMSLNKDDKAKLLTANSLWLSENIILSDNADNDFFNPVKQYYNAEKKQLNLASEDAMKQMNQWVSDNTNGMIDSILDEPLYEDIEMTLLNAVYFKGKWKEKFEKENTQKKKFYGKNKTSETDMMYQENTEYKYIEKNGMKAIELPYANGKIAMDIFIPMSDEKKNEKYKNISELFSNLSVREKSDLFKALSEAEEETISVLELPKFDLEYGTADISEGLQNIGMKAPFEHNAEFSKISSNLWVDKVLHKAKIEVNEEGSKASAVTAIIMGNDVCVLVDEEEKKEFIADKPFIFAIRDVENDVILFMGSMQDCE